jgi:hypothetical protein
MIFRHECLASDLLFALVVHCITASLSVMQVTPLILFSVNEQMPPNEYRRNARFDSLAEYDHLAKSDDFIEVTEWHNGEGFDVHLSTNAGEQRMSFSWGEYQALKATLGDWAENNLEDEE